MRIKTRESISSWLYNYGRCKNYWIEFTRKQERDFEATQYPDALQIKKGNWKRGKKGNQKDIFWLSICVPLDHK